MGKYILNIRERFSEKAQKTGIIVALFILFVAVFSVWPWATGEFENISDRAVLDQRIAEAISSHQSEICIDYSGPDWKNLKQWIKEDFRYPVLSQYTDEFSIYNYESAKFTYWTYKDRKRVQITISYKMTAEEMLAINAFADNMIGENNLKGKTPYEQVKIVHDWLIANYSYNLGSNNLYQMIQDKKANCYGYTMMNYVILNRLGIPIKTTYGRLRGSHIWNAVQLDGTWYYEDVTWDTVDSNYNYFLISSEKLKKTHTIEGNFIIECPSDYVQTSAKTVVNDAAEQAVPSRISKLSKTVNSLKE